MSLRTLGFRGAAQLALASLVLTGCPGPTATLDIVSPEDGAVLSPATDTNPTLAGVQAEIRVEAVGIAVGDEVDLVVDEAIIATVPTPDDGQIVFPDVTLSPGDHVLRASTRAGSIESLSIDVLVESQECFAINFVTPEPSGTRVTLGPADDTDGEACGTTFETTVLVATTAPDGSEARILVNGAPQRTATVSAGVARFEGVAFDRRGSDENVLSVEIAGASGSTCSQAYPVPLLVDCGGVSCTITSPEGDGGFLNQGDDVSDEDGFQGDFEVTTDEDGAGQPIRFIIDGDESNALSEMPDGAVATFGNVTLSEGVHRVQAECTDSAGNATRSAAVEWTVDITGCGVTLDSPTEGTVFIDEDDVDAATDGIQISAAGTAAEDCERLRVGQCAVIDALSYGPAEADWASTVTLGSSRNQDVCAQTLDAAGNTTTAMVGVVLNTMAPQLAVTSPLPDAAYNREGGAGRTADLDPSSATCEAAFTVNCTDVGLEVQLLRGDTMTGLAGGTATCEAVAGLPAPYAGQAVFPNVSLPTIDDGTPLSVVARQESERLVGFSDPVALLTDCEPPVLAVAEPTCGATLRMSDDSDTTTPGVQHRVLFQNPNVPKPDVTLEIRDDSGASVYGPVTSSEPPSTAVTSFVNANFGGAGEFTITGRAVDNAGNEGVASCNVTVDNLPTLSISEPSAGAVLSSADDCDPSATGLQVNVRATTDAGEGSPATIQIGSDAAVATTVSSGAVTGCVSVTEGRSVTIGVSVTDAGRGSAMASIVVSVDTSPPSASILDFAPQFPAADRRGGIVNFSWEDVADEDGSTLESFDVRCSSAPITSEAAWAAATSRTIMNSPGSAGTVQSADISGFRIGIEYFCVLRAADIAGALTPLPPTAPASVLLEFLTEGWDSPATGDGRSLAAIGDVNGDGIDDVLVGAEQGAAVYFGSAAGLPTSPSVRILPPSGGISFGADLAGLGDFNGDGIGDFVVADRNGNSFMGAVYVFFGTPAWPSTVDLSAGCPGLCLNGTAANGRLGWDVASAGDFDGDGFADLAIGAVSAGKVYVVRGTSTTGTFELPGATPSATLDAFEISAPVGTQLFGISVTSPGDLTGDGRSELIIGSPGSGSSGISGAIFRVEGRAFDAASTGVVPIPETEVVSLVTGGAGTFGTVVRSAGDVDGDGLVDLVVYDATSAGRVVLLRQQGGTYSSGGAVAFTNDLTGATDDLFGTALGLGGHAILGRLGDLDRDGRTELLVGSAERGADAGTVDIFYGATPVAARARSGADLVLDPQPEPTDGTRRGQFVGDVNGDGYADVAVGGVNDASGAGRVLLYY